MQSIDWPFLQLIAIQKGNIALIMWEVSIKFVQMDHQRIPVQHFINIVVQVLGMPADQQIVKFNLSNVMKQKGNLDYRIIYLPSKLCHK